MLVYKVEKGEEKKHDDRNHVFLWRLGMIQQRNLNVMFEYVHVLKSISVCLWAQVSLKIIHSHLMK